MDKFKLLKKGNLEEIKNFKLINPMTIEISTEMQNMTLAPTDNKSFFGSTSQRQLTQTQPSTHL